MAAYISALLVLVKNKPNVLAVGFVFYKVDLFSATKRNYNVATFLLKKCWDFGCEHFIDQFKDRGPVFFVNLIHQMKLLKIGFVFGGYEIGGLPSLSDAV